MEKYPYVAFSLVGNKSTEPGLSTCYNGTIWENHLKTVVHARASSDFVFFLRPFDVLT